MSLYETLRSIVTYGSKKNQPEELTEQQKILHPEIDENVELDVLISRKHENLISAQTSRFDIRDVLMAGDDLDLNQDGSKNHSKREIFSTILNNTYKTILETQKKIYLKQKSILIEM